MGLVVLVFGFVYRVGLRMGAYRVGGLGVYGSECEYI